MRHPRCVIIAGPNGAGKTTFATDFLPRKRGITHFVNADLIAAGLSPLDPAFAQVTARRIFLREIDQFSDRRADFGFESTLSGRTYVNRLRLWKKRGYRIEIVCRRSTWPRPVSRPAFVKEGTTFPISTSNVGMNVDGQTFAKSTSDLRTRGACSTIRLLRAASLKNCDEIEQLR